MIYVEMYGRLGNQFFRYAAARACQLRLYPNEQLCLSFQQVQEAGKADDTFYNVLQDYCVAPYIEYEKTGKVIFNESSIRQKITCIPYYLGMKNIRPEQMNAQVGYERKWLDRLQNQGMYWFRRGGWSLEASEVQNKFLSGCFEDPMYFNDIRDVLLDELTPAHPPRDCNRELLQLIQETNSICVSVRRGDFESNPDVQKLQSVCHKQYFERAIEQIICKVDNPTFFMFSDDIEWVKKNVRTNCVTYYESGNDPVWEKLRLMSQCKHFIISNSTFSWWAQYLSTRDSKIVVSPSRWFNNDYDSPLIDEKWIRIDV